MLANPEVQIAAGITSRFKISGALKFKRGLVRSGKVGRAANQPRNVLRQRIQHLARTLARSYTLCIGGKGRKILVPSIGKLATLHAMQPIREFRIFP